MIIKFLKPFSFLPAILLMYMIFSFSAQDGTTSASLSYQVSYKIVEVGGEVLGADLQPWELDQLATRFHTPVRKLAHMTEYFLLAIAVAFPLYVYGLRGILLLITAGAICVAFACGDEYHQAFVDGRGPSKRDVLIDSIGVFFGIVLVRIIGWTGRNTIFRPFARKKRQESAVTVDSYMTDPRVADPRINDPLMSDRRKKNTRMSDPRMSNPHMDKPRRNSTRVINSRRSDPRMDNPRVSDPHAADPRNYYYEPYPPDYQDPNYYGPAQYDARPQAETGPYYERSYYKGPYYNDPYSDPFNDPYDDPYNDPYGESYDDPYSEEDSRGTSDRLSEDMSLRKLMSDLKDQKKARRKTDAPQ